MFNKWLRTKPTEAPQTAAPPAHQPDRQPAIDVPGGVVFDEEDLLRRLMGDRDLVGLVVGGFLKDAPVQLTNLSNRLEAADAPGVRAHSHAFKGAAGTVAAERLQAIAGEMEKAGIAGRLDRCNELMPHAIEEFERYKNALEQSQWV